MIHRSSCIALLLTILAPINSLCATQPSLELSFTYPANIISIGIKENNSHVSIELSYKYSQGSYSFTSQSSPQSNPCIALSAHLLTEQMNTIVRPYKKDPRLELFIRQLSKQTFIKQKNELENLKKNTLNLSHYLDKNDPIYSEIENRIKNLEVYYG